MVLFTLSQVFMEVLEDKKKENMNGDFPPCRQTGSAGDVD